MFQPLHTSGIDVVLAICNQDHVLTGLTFIFAGLVASISTWHNYNNIMIHALLFTPQQFLLFISAIGVIQAMITGHFADGTVRSWQFIFVDQVYLVILCVGHAFAMICGYGFRSTAQISLC